MKVDKKIIDAGISEKKIVAQLAVIVKNIDNRRFLFKRIKNLYTANLVAYYYAARTYADWNLSAAIRTAIFERAL